MPERDLTPLVVARSRHRRPQPVIRVGAGGVDVADDEPGPARGAGSC